MAQNDKSDLKFEQTINAPVEKIVVVGQAGTVNIGDRLQTMQQTAELRHGYQQSFLWRRVTGGGDARLVDVVQRVVDDACDLTRELCESDDYKHFCFYDETHLENVLAILDQIVLGEDGCEALTPVEAAFCVMSVYLHDLEMAPPKGWFDQLRDETNGLELAYADHIENYPRLERALRLAKEDALPSDRALEGKAIQLIDSHLLRMFVQHRVQQQKANEESNLNHWLSEMESGRNDYFNVDRDENLRWKSALARVARSAHHSVGWLRHEWEDLDQDFLKVWHPQSRALRRTCSLREYFKLRRESNA